MATDVSLSTPTTGQPSGRRSSSAMASRQPGLDGVRGVALLVVLAYHGGLPWTRGAFLALSQFFTLSGFLITGILLRRHLVPGGGLRSFWIRRIRRLMPAAFLALAGIVVFGATVATRQQAQALPGDVLAAATWTANWRFLLNGQSYINLFAAPSPVQHFWSLAIEEQFYVVYPIGLLLLLRKTRSPRVIGSVVAGAALLSTAWMILLYEHGATLDRLYYGSDTRAAELLAGGVLGVFVWHRGTDFTERTRCVLAGAGAVAFAVSAWCWVNISLADGPIWRGGFLLYSMLSCAVILGVLSARGPLAAFMSWGPLPTIGRLSYGVYLYHWPLFLWLTEQRTGLSRWPLFALRMIVTFGAAMLSYRFVEQPVLRGASFGLPRRVRYAIAPLVAVAVVAATFVTVDRSAYDPLAALRLASGQAQPPGSAAPFKLLVIPARADDPAVQSLQKLAASQHTAQVAVAPPFECTGGLVATKTGRTCANWARTWPALIDRIDPDVVLLDVNYWAGQSLSKLSGLPASKGADAALRILTPALNLLTARGAPVVWAYSLSTIAQMVNTQYAPFGQAMLRLRAQRKDIFTIIPTESFPAGLKPPQVAAQTASVLLSASGLYRRTQGNDQPRVLVVGDSQALSMGYGLQQWGAQNRRALVWNRGVEGCGVVADGELRAFGRTASNVQSCRDAVLSWPSEVKEFRPAVVVVFSTLKDVQDRRIPGASKFSSFGDADFDAFLIKEYVHDVDTLSATGAHVVWMTAPCTGADASVDDHLNSAILPKVVRERPGRVSLFDMAGVLCPNGKPMKSVDGVKDVRPDGTHFSVEGSRWFADKYGRKVLALGGLR